MIQVMVSIIIDNLIRNGTIDQEDMEKYTYGVEIVIEKLITYTVLFILALVLKVLVPSALFILFFITLRGYTGGFHARTYLGCFISTIVIYLCSSQIFVPFFIMQEKYIIPCIIVSSISIILLAPMNHPNINLSINEKKRCKIGSRSILTIEIILIFIGIYSKINTVYYVFPFLGVLLCAVLLIIAKIMRQEVKQNGKQLN